MAVTDQLPAEVDLGLRAWDQQPDEPVLWFSRFERYRRMGPTRSLLGAVRAEEAEAGREEVSRWPAGSWVEAAKRWNWKARAQAWDRSELERLRREEAEAAEQMRRCHIGAGRAALSLFVNWLEKVQMAIENGADPSEVLSPSDAVKILSEGVRIERLARGEPDSIQRRQVEGDEQQGAQLTFNLVDVVKAIRQLGEQEQQPRDVPLIVDQGPPAATADGDGNGQSAGGSNGLGG